MNDVEAYELEMSKMGRAIPGESLTSDPENPAPYEKSPQFTNVHEATVYLWDSITEPEQYQAYMIGMSKGVPVMSIVQVILFDEFQQGSWNPDLMLMLAEPLAYMLIALAERLDIDIKIDNEEEEGDVFGVEMEEERLKKIRESALDSGLVPAGIITEEMAAEMETLPSVSLLEKPEDAEAVQEQPSLMAQPEGQ
jgi:hypothetical protein